MPRRSGGSAGRAPARPSVPSRQPAPPMKQQPTRPATTMAGAPPKAAQQAPTQSQGPGLFGQMASTAAGVAIGSSIGHAVGSLFTGSSSEAPAEQYNNTQQANTAQSQGWNCAGAAQQFTKCMDEHGGNMQICNWYLDQLKACQAAAKEY